MNKLYGVILMLAMLLSVSGCGKSSVEVERVNDNNIVDTVSGEDYGESIDSTSSEADDGKTIDSIDGIDSKKENDDMAEAADDENMLENDDLTGLSHIEIAHEYLLKDEYENALEEYKKVRTSEYDVNYYHNYAFLVANSNGHEEIKRAFELYDKAYNLGDSDAVSNSFAAWIYYGTDKNIEYLRKLINVSIDTSDSRVINYCSAISGKDGVETLKELQKLDDAELFNYVVKNTRYFDDCGEVKATCRPTDTRDEKYVYVGSYNWYDDEKEDAGTVYVYNKWRANYPNIELLGENWK